MALVLSIEEQKLRDFAAAVLPPWATKDLAYDELLSAFAVIFNRCRQQVDFWWDQSFIGRAEGPDGGGPDFLDMLARDLGTGRTAGETQEALRARLREAGLAVTRPAILEAIDAMLDAAGIAGASAAVEVRRDRARFGSYVSQTGTGGTFENPTGSVWTFAPVVPFELPVETGYARSGRWGNPQLLIGGSSGNDGTYEVTDLSGDAVVYTGGGVAGLDPTCTWTLKKRDAEDNVRDGFARGFLSRGYRMGRRGVVIILPYGTTDAVAAAVRELVRQRKAFGFRAVVEVRATAP